MNAAFFSRRLSSIAFTSVCLALTLGFALSGIQHMLLEANSNATWLMIAIIAIFALLTIAGWQYCIKRRSTLLLHGYFIIQVIILTALFWIENSQTRNGASIGNLSVVLLLQCGVLPLQSMLFVYLVTNLYLIGISAVFLPIHQVILPSLVLFTTNGAVVLISHLLIREEQAQIALQGAHQKLAQSLTQVEELAIARERNRLAADIHDSLGHYLTAINVQLEVVKTLSTTEPQRLYQNLERIQGLTKESLTELRRAVSAMHATPQSDPLHEAISQLVDEHRASNFEADYRVEGLLCKSSPLVTQTLYRAAQEALTNIRKHAQAKHTLVTLRYGEDKRIRLVIADDGVGADHPDHGFGLLGLQERVTALGGYFEVTTRPGAGFSVCVELAA